MIFAFATIVAGFNAAYVEHALADPAGSDCAADATCNNDLFCDFESVPTICIFRRPAGSNCDRNRQCEVGLTCNGPAGSQTCRGGAAVGEECTADVDCADPNSNYCGFVFGGAGVRECMAKKPLGDTCERQAECLGNGTADCIDGVCKCQADEACPAGQVCNATNECVNRPCINTGARCTRGGTPTCCTGPAGCLLNAFDGNFYCRNITPPGVCMPIGQQCQPGGIACCNGGVCNLGICVIPFNPDPPDPGPQTGIRLLEPIGNVTEIPTANASGFGPFFFFFNLLYPWFLGLGAAIAVLMGVIGGIQIMWSGGNDTIHSAGMQRFLLSLGGLILLLFSSLILNLLNPNFFR